MKESLIAEYQKILSLDKVAENNHIKALTLYGAFDRWGIKRVGNDSKTIVEHDYFDVMDEKRYWMLGIYASDGTVDAKSKNYISLTQSGDNGLKIINYISEELKCINGRRDFDPNDGY